MRVAITRFINIQDCQLKGYLHTKTYHVYSADTGVQHDDLFLQENATLKRPERAQLLKKLYNINPTKHDLRPKVYVPQSNGDFSSVEFYVMPDQHIVDMSRNFDFSLEKT